MGPGAGGRGREAPPRTLWPPLPGASRRRDPAAWEQPPAATTTGPGARGPGPPPASCARTAAPADSSTRSPSPPPRRPRPRPSCARAPAPPPLALLAGSAASTPEPRAPAPAAGPLPPSFGPSASSPGPTYTRREGPSLREDSCTAPLPAPAVAFASLRWSGWGVRSLGSARTVPCARGY